MMMHNKSVFVAMSINQCRKTAIVEILSMQKIARNNVGGYRATLSEVAGKSLNVINTNIFAE